jgi:phosphoglycerate dehydrogenase-like enzyme
MKAARFEPISEAMLDQIAGEVPDLLWANAGAGTFATDFADAHVLGDVVVVYGRPGPASLAAMPVLKWIHVPFAGVSTEMCRIASERRITVTNSSGIYNQTIAEYTLCMMLALARRLDVMLRHQIARQWEPSVGNLASDLSGQTVAIIGAGGIGRAIARLCKAFGMQVLASRRRPQPTPFVDQLFGPDELALMAGKADWLVIAAPLTVESQGVVNARVLASLPRGARLVNVSRGKIIDEAALAEAVRSGHLAGAALDVTVEEPLPASSPLWDLPGVLITPHVAGAVANGSNAAAQLFLRNLHHFRAGRPFESIVDLEYGY